MRILLLVLTLGILSAAFCEKNMVSGRGSQLVSASENVSAADWVGPDRKPPKTSLLFIWHPVRFVSKKLGDGFFAGVFAILLLAVPGWLGFAFVKLVSSKLRFLPNIILYILMLAITLFTLMHTAGTIFMASCFTNIGGYGIGLFGFFGLAVVVGTFWGARAKILERRCPGCAHWIGKALRRQKTGETTITTTTEYSDGSRDRISSTTEYWEDYCACSLCGKEWKLRRIEKT